MQNRLLARLPSSGVALAVAATVAACATHYTWDASVPLPGPIGSVCMKKALESEDDVIDVVAASPDSVAFRLRMLDRTREDSPSFSLREGDDLDGIPTLSLSTGYATGLFEPNENDQLLRARALVVSVAEKCTGERPTLGESRPCGAGEIHDLCVRERHSP
jgi:hypothetical protein